MLPGIVPYLMLHSPIHACVFKSNAVLVSLVDRASLSCQLKKMQSRMESLL